MKRTAIAIAIAAATVLTACGSDDSSSSISGPQADAAQAAIDSAAEEGITLDEDCVNDVAAQLSDADAELAAAGGDAELSPEGEALTVELVACADPDELIDSIIGNLGADGTSFDEGCVREALQGLDLSALVAAGEGDEPPAEFVEALIPCFEG
jgi:hypothetical protein